MPSNCALAPAVKVFETLAIGNAVPGAAHAYPWMIRHGYSGCGVCHVDPSGAGLLTDYGRAQSELLMATRWSEGHDSTMARIALPR